MNTDLNVKKWNYLKKALVSKKFPHAILVSGTSYREFILNVFDLDFGLDIDKFFHPDVVIIRAADKEIKIDQIRDCVWRLSLKPSLLDFKIALINDAHNLNVEASAALLKTLEEPKGNSIFVLISNYPEAIPLTLLSRVQKLKFCSTEEKNIVVDNVFTKKISQLAKADMAERFRYAKEIADSSDINQILVSWLHYFRRDLERNARTLKLIQKIIFLINKTSVNKKIALEHLMLEIF